MGARGEITLRVGETEYRILFTNRAIAEAEAALGKSIIAVAREFGIGDVGRLLATGMEAARREAKTGGRAYTVNDAYCIMDEVGFTAAATVVMEAVAAVLSHSSEAEGVDAERNGEPESPNP